MAAGPLIKGNLDIGLYIKSLKKVTMNAADNVDSKIGLAYEVIKDSDYQRSELSFAGIAPYTTWSMESETIGRQKIEQRYKSTFTQVGYATAVSYTYLNKKFLKRSYGLLEEQAQELGTKAAHTKELLAASFFINQLAGSGTKWNTEENKYLFDATHPLANGGTYSNLVTGGLSVAKVQEAVTLLEGTVDDMGLLMGMKAKRLWVARDLEFVALESLNRGIKLRPDTANNTVNALSDWGLELVVWPYLPAGVWGVQGSRTGTLWIPSIDLEQEQYEDKATKDTIHQAIFATSFGARDWRGWVFSAGS